MICSREICRTARGRGQRRRGQIRGGPGPEWCPGVRTASRPEMKREFTIANRLWPDCINGGYWVKLVGKEMP